MSLHLITGYAGEEHITSSDHASFNIAMFGDGEYVLDKGNKFEASVITNNLIRILDGDLMLQGRHVRLKENTYEELELENGSQGMYRNDLIVVRYSKASVTGIEKCEFVVLKGEASSTQAGDPTYTTGDITELGNALITEFPLYRIKYDGLNIQEVEALFTVETTIRNKINTAVSSLSDRFKTDSYSNTTQTFELPLRKSALVVMSTEGNSDLFIVSNYDEDGKNVARLSNNMSTFSVSISGNTVSVSNESFWYKYNAIII